MNNQKVAAALRLLAEAFETPAATADLPPASPGEAPAAPKRGRGRPVAGETPAAQTPAPAVVEADPFDTTPPAATAPAATLDDVRTAMKALAAATTQDNALAVLKEAGGVANLTELQRTPEKYGAVVLAAKAQLPTTTQPAEDPFETTAPAAAPEVPAGQQKVTDDVSMTYEIR